MDREYEEKVKEMEKEMQMKQTRSMLEMDVPNIHADFKEAPILQIVTADGQILCTKSLDSVKF